MNRKPDRVHLPSPTPSPIDQKIQQNHAALLKLLAQMKKRTRKFV